MITEQQQEQASLCAVGALPADERIAFEAELRSNTQLRQLLLELQGTTELLTLSAAVVKPPTELRDKVLARIDALVSGQNASPLPPTALAGLRFVDSAGARNWKPLPFPGAFIKLLSLERERGYAVLMGKLEPGARFPAHVNAGPEDFYILTGDLAIGDRKLVAGDFHHADQGSQHAENCSVEGCMLLAVLTTDDPLIALAMA